MNAKYFLLLPIFLILTACEKPVTNNDAEMQAREKNAARRLDRAFTPEGQAKICKGLGISVSDCKIK